MRLFGDSLNILFLVGFLLCNLRIGILRNLGRTRTCIKPELEKNLDSTLGLTFEKAGLFPNNTRTRFIKNPNSNCTQQKQGLKTFRVNL